jgi:hypothetical protein
MLDFVNKPWGRLSFLSFGKQKVIFEMYVLLLTPFQQFLQQLCISTIDSHVADGLFPIEFDNKQSNT